MMHTILQYLAANWLEDAGVVTTLVGIWLTTRRLMLCWPIVLAADVIYFVVFYRAKLLSDSLLQIFFVAFTLYGWWHWWHGMREEGEVRVEPLTGKNLLIGLVAGVVGGALLGAITKQLHAALPFVDASLTSFSLVASWWQARKHTANWWLWIVVDVIYIVEYMYKALWGTAVLYAILVALAALGLRDWRRAETESRQTAACTTLRSGSPAM